MNPLEKLKLDAYTQAKKLTVDLATDISNLIDEYIREAYDMGYEDGQEGK